MTTGEPHPRPISPMYFHDIIEFHCENKARKFEIVRPIYMQGSSLGEIERQTGIAKTSIRELLIAHGLTLRKFSLAKRKNKNGKKGMRSGVTPYGYAYLNGQLVLAPNEYKVVQKILKLWHKGKAAKAICEELNDQRILTRMSKKWSASTVARVIKRHETPIT